MLANQAQLRGDMELPPTRALEIFMMTVDLNARIEGEVIVVSEDRSAAKKLLDPSRDSTSCLASGKR
jgi:hypothetical protein